MLRGHRVSRGMTQEDLAAASGLSVRAIRNLEIGRTRQPHPQSARLLAGALGLTDQACADLLRAARQGGRQPRPTAPAPRVSAEVPRGRCELPADVPDLVGRAEVSDQLVRALTERVPASVARLAVVTGGPGSGRTALVVRVAHRLRRQFPDGQLHVDLRGLPAGPQRAAALLGRLLRSLGAVNPPESVDERAALLRAELSVRRVLVVLDDVDGEADVRPLLTGSSTSALLVAARRPLVTLKAAATVKLGPLSERAAVHLLASVVGDSRAAAEPAATVAVARACWRLPLALRIAGSWLVARPYRRMSDLATLLRDERTRLDHLSVGDLSLRASVLAHLSGLDATERAALRSVARIGGVHFGLCDLVGLPAAGDGVERLLLANLLTPTPDGRYRMESYVRACVGDRDTPLVPVAAVR
ncbi:helix-turn-helix domain-containing protein [Actinokineospora soli]|uniref:Helix-turn-helix domain-containing protein n=1 Tax=Actinokineospora soli TaxID=1048753 RepID=A0ABW2TUC0_9PSEU